MALTYGFFNSINHDRTYSAEQISALFDGLIHDGVFDSIGDIFATVPGEGLQVLVKSGKAWFNHTWTINDTPMPLSIPTPDVLLSRIDAVVLEVNSTESVRANSIKLKTGTPSSTPAKPEMLSTENVHQYPLAYVTVAASATAITVSDIEINVGKSSCPFVTGIIQSTDIDDLFNQWEGEFDTWFENLKTQLSDDVVTNLQGQIDQKLDKADKATTEMIQAGTDDTHYITPKGMKEGSQIQIEGTDSLKMKLVYDSVEPGEHWVKGSPYGTYSVGVGEYIYTFPGNGAGQNNSGRGEVRVNFSRWKINGGSENIISEVLVPAYTPTTPNTSSYWTVTPGKIGVGDCVGACVYASGYRGFSDEDTSNISYYMLIVAAITQEGIRYRRYSPSTNYTTWFPHFSNDYVVFLSGASNSQSVSICVLGIKQSTQYTATLLPTDSGRYDVSPICVKDNIFYYLYRRRSTSKTLYVGSFNLVTRANTLVVSVMDFSTATGTELNSDHFVHAFYKNENEIYFSLRTTFRFIKLDLSTFNFSPNIYGLNRNGSDFLYVGTKNGVHYIASISGNTIFIFHIVDDQLVKDFEYTDAGRTGIYTVRNWFAEYSIKELELSYADRDIISPRCPYIISLEEKTVKDVYRKDPIRSRSYGSSDATRYDGYTLTPMKCVIEQDEIADLSRLSVFDYTLPNDPVTGAARGCAVGLKNINYIGEFSVT